MNLIIEFSLWLIDAPTTNDPINTLSLESKPGQKSVFLILVLVLNKWTMFPT